MAKGALSMLAGISTGAALAYFLDPATGDQRRKSAADKVKSSGSPVSDRLGKVPVNLSSAGLGGLKEAVRRGPKDNPNPDDNTLRDRVETEVFGDPTVPKGELNLNVVDGVVVLRGELATQTQIDDLISKVRTVEHVRGVESYLHLPGTPAPNKESAIEAS